MEFRSQGWYQEAIYALMRRYNVALCVHDMARKGSPLVTTADFGYVRFHGTTGQYAGSYSDAQLREWAQRIRGPGPDLKAVYIYFNNDIGGHAVSNARTLTQLLM
jgi:uncharacterized protein YecE (DUF72 family)